MPLIVICGQPCSGKSTVAAQLVQVFQEKGISTCNLVDEPSLHLLRNNAYKDVPSEKNTRALLKSTTERYIGRKGVTILDSLNNIKGYRYELWCIARAAGTRYCMVHVDTPVEQCKAWNAARDGDKYNDEIFKDLACRFERPDARNRWDAPLFTIRPSFDQSPASQAHHLTAFPAHSPAQLPSQVLAPPSAQQPPVQLSQDQKLTPMQPPISGQQASQALPAGSTPTRSAFRLAAGMKAGKAAQAAAAAAGSQTSLQATPAASLVSGRMGRGGPAASAFGGTEGSMSSRLRASEAAAAGSTASWVSANGQEPSIQCERSQGQQLGTPQGEVLSVSSLKLHDPGHALGQAGSEGGAGSQDGGISQLLDEGEESNGSMLKAIAEAMVGGPEHMSMRGTCHLKPSSATSNPTMLLGTNLLHDIDQAAQDVVNKISEAQSSAAGGAAGRVDCSSGPTTEKRGEYLIHFDKPITLPELRRHKRAFLKLATKITFSRLQDGEAAKRTFLDYLISNIPGASRPPQHVF